MKQFKIFLRLGLLFGISMTIFEMLNGKDFNILRTLFYMFFFGIPVTLFINYQKKIKDKKGNNK